MRRPARRRIRKQSPHHAPLLHLAAPPCPLLPPPLPSARLSPPRVERHRRPHRRRTAIRPRRGDRPAATRPAVPAVGRRAGSSSGTMGTVASLRAVPTSRVAVRVSKIFSVSSFLWAFFSTTNKTDNSNSGSPADARGLWLACSDHISVARDRHCGGIGEVSPPSSDAAGSQTKR
jgi:hypothetical protein